MHRDPSLRSRRWVLVGGALGGVAALAGCGWLDDDADPPAGTVEPTAPPVDADSELVDEIGREIAEAGAVAARVADRFAPLQPVARAFADLHDAHLGELQWDGTVERSPRLGGRAEAERLLLEAEERVQGRLVRASLAAESGALAQVLASMAAAVAQQRAVTA